MFRGRGKLLLPKQKIPELHFGSVQKIRQYFLSAACDVVVLAGSDLRKGTDPAVFDDPASSGYPAASDSPGTCDLLAASDFPDICDLPAVSDFPDTCDLLVASDDPAACEDSATSGFPAVHDFDLSSASDSLAV